MTDPTPVLRVGDRERSVVDARLQAAVGEGVLTLAEYDERSAQVWAARTQAELAELVADLPPRPALPARSVPGAPGPARRVVAVMSQDELGGPVAVGQSLRAYAVMGEARVDLRRDDLPGSVEVVARAVMGEVTVLVPRGARVHLSGASVMGERKVRVAPPSPDGPIVHVNAYALMGSVTVRHGRPGRPGASYGTVERVAGPRRPRRPRRGRRALGFLGAAALALGVLVGGQAVVASADDGRAVFGSSRVVVPEGDDAVSVGVLFGSVEVVVPDGVQVVSRGTVVFGSVDCDRACTGDGPVLELDASGGFGSVSVVTESEARVGRPD